MSKFISNARLLRIDQHFQATNATICGTVEIGPDASFWFGSTVRGDVAKIIIGPRSNIQELACLHVDDDVPLEIGADVTIGHGAVVHGKSVGDGTLIGMKAVLLSGVVIGKNCLVAAGCVVSPNTVVPDGMMIVGVPGKVLRPVKESELAYMRSNCAHYVELARDHADHPEKYYQ